MKRVLLFLMLTALLLSTGGIGAWAEDAFSIRNGITWGMSSAEVEQREGGEEEAYRTEYDNGCTRLWYEDKSVSRFPCELRYAFYNDRLYLVEYSLPYYFWEMERVRINAYLDNALTALYGPGYTASYPELMDVTDVLNVTEYYVPEEMVNTVIRDLEDGTRIVLFRCGEENVLAYFMPEILFDFLPADGVFNTDGL